MADTREELDLILLKAHPRPASIAKATTAKLAGDLSLFDMKPCRQPLEDDNERLSVGLPGGQKAEHGCQSSAKCESLPTGRR